MKLFDIMHKSNYKKIGNIPNACWRLHYYPFFFYSLHFSWNNWKTQPLARKTVILQVACGIQKKGELMWKNTGEEPKTKIYITRAFNKHTKCNNKIYCLNLCAQVLYWIKLSFDDSSFHFWVQVIIHSSLAFLSALRVHQRQHINIIGPFAWNWYFTSYIYDMVTRLWVKRILPLNSFAGSGSQGTVSNISSCWVHVIITAWN